MNDAIKIGQKRSLDMDKNSSSRNTSKQFSFHLTERPKKWRNSSAIKH